MKRKFWVFMLSLPKGMVQCHGREAWDFRCEALSTPSSPARPASISRSASMLEFNYLLLTPHTHNMSLASSASCKEALQTKTMKWFYFDNLEYLCEDIHILMCFLVNVCIMILEFQFSLFSIFCITSCTCIP